MEQWFFLLSLSNFLEVIILMALSLHVKSMQWYGVCMPVNNYWASGESLYLCSAISEHGSGNVFVGKISVTDSWPSK
jgi:hypothetical protein